MHLRRRRRFDASRAGRYETVLGRKVQVELTESVLRGGKRCTFVVRIGSAA